MSTQMMVMLLSVLVGAIFIVNAVLTDDSPVINKKFKTLKKKETTFWATVNVFGGFNALWLGRFTKIKDNTTRKLTRADAPLNVNGFFFIKELLLVVGVVEVIMMGLEGPIAMFLPLVLFIIPNIILGTKISHREYRILRTFPEIIDLMGLCLTAGLDFIASLRWLTEGAFLFDNPFIDELKRLKEEILLGKSKIDALKTLDKRLEIPEVSSLVRTLVIAEQMGVSVIDTFSRFSADVRDRRFQRGERQARMSAIKILFPLIFLILPVVGIVIIGPIVLQFMQQDFMGSMGM